MQTLSPLCRFLLLRFPVHLFQWRLLKTFNRTGETGPSPPAAGRAFLQRNWTTKGEIRKKGFKYATSTPPKLSCSCNPLPYCKFLQTVNVVLRAGAAVESVQGSSFTGGPVFRFSHSVMGRDMFPTNPPAGRALLLQSGLQASLLWRIAWGVFMMWWKPSFQNTGLSLYFHLLAQLRMSNKCPVRTSVCIHFTLATHVSLLWG